MKTTYEKQTGLNRITLTWGAAIGTAILYLLLTSGCQQQPVRVYKVSSGTPAGAATGFEQPQGAPSYAPNSASPFADNADPALSNMIPENYHIGTGDVLQIKISQLLDLQKDELLVVEVDHRGQIYLPLLNHVQVSGMTADQVRSELAQRLAREYIRDPKVDVSIQRYSSKEVMVLGVVGKPGPLALRADCATLMDVISQAGGITTDAAPNIEIYRGANLFSPTPAGLTFASWPGEMASPSSRKEIVPIVLLYTEGAGRINPLIFAGDVVKVPRSDSGFIYVSGEVRQPGAKPYRIPMTILQAVSSAGGITRIAKEQNCRIIRRLPDGSESTLTVNLAKVEKNKDENIKLCQNDTVIIPVDPTEKFFDDIFRIFHAGVNTGVDAGYDAGYDMGFPGHYEPQ